tara:strand:+ start:329 stop:505 length:177 start_codon:yes stop_codon:yes gene_type:complete
MPQAPLERLDSLLRPVRLVGVDQFRNLARVRVRVRVDQFRNLARVRVRIGFRANAARI